MPTNLPSDGGTGAPPLQLSALPTTDPLDPVAILRPADSSPLGAYGMPPAEAALASRDGQTVEMRVEYATAPVPEPWLVRAREMSREGDKLYFRGADDTQTPLPLSGIRSVENTATGVKVFYTKPEQSETEDTDAPLHAALLEERVDYGSVVCGKLLKQLGAALLEMNGHGKTPAYLAWEKEVDEFIRSAVLPEGSAPPLALPEH